MTQTHPASRMPGASSGRLPITLVLDLDETLIFSSGHPCPCDFAIDVTSQHRVWVNVRPHLSKFLCFASKYFEVGLFTAGLEEVASKIVDRVDSHKAFSFRMFKDDCKLTHGGGYVKDLTKLRPRPLRSVVLVDDNPLAYSLQPECSLPIKKFTGQLDDNELEILAKQLELLLKHCSCPESFSAGLHFLRLHRQYCMKHEAHDEEQWLQYAQSAISDAQSVTGSLTVHGTYFQAPAVKVRGSRQQPIGLSLPSNLALSASDAVNMASMNFHKSSTESRNQFPSSMYMSTPDRNGSAPRGRHGFGVKSISSSFSEYEQPVNPQKIPSQLRSFGSVPEVIESSRQPLRHESFSGDRAVDVKLYQSMPQQNQFSPSQLKKANNSVLRLSSSGSEKEHHVSPLKVDISSGRLVSSTDSGSNPVFNNPSVVSINSPALPKSSVYKADNYIMQHRSRIEHSPAPRFRQGSAGSSPARPGHTFHSTGLADQQSVPAQYLSQPDKKTNQSQTSAFTSVASAGPSQKMNDIARPTLPRYFPLLVQLMLEIDNLAKDLQNSLDYGLKQMNWMEESEPAHFRLQHSEKESILREKIRSTELLTIARVGLASGRVLRQCFQDLDILVTKFRSRTNPIELKSLLYQLQERQQEILHRFLDLEGIQTESGSFIPAADDFQSAGMNGSNGGAVVISDSDGAFFGKSSMSPQNWERHTRSQQVARVGSLASSALHPKVAELAGMNQHGHLYIDNPPIQAPSLHVPPILTKGFEAQSALNTQPQHQQSSSASRMIQVSLARNDSGFGISFTKSGLDVVIAAITTGSPSHRGGLLRGDLLLSVNSTSVHDFVDCQELIAYMKTQSTLTLNFLRIEWEPPVAKTGHSGLPHFGESPRARSHTPATSSPKFQPATPSRNQDRMIHAKSAFEYARGSEPGGAHHSTSWHGGAPNQSVLYQSSPWPAQISSRNTNSKTSSGMYMFSRSADDQGIVC